MTDKQIMIDGIDVSGCEDYGYRGSAGYWCHNYDEPCTDYPNCYFKQLARKEQECEAVEYDYQKQLENTNKWIAECENLQQQIDKLKASKEQAEQKLEKIRQVAESCIKGNVTKIRMEQILQIIDEVE